MRVRYIVLGFLYRWVAKPLMFRLSADRAHALVTNRIASISQSKLLLHMVKLIIKPKVKEVTYDGINFISLVGLSAGFEYTGKSLKALACLGFGFVTVGTLTNMPYAGNTPPRLGRLPKSRSLLVNKGFRNEGIAVVLKRLKEPVENLVVGISIGQSPQLTDINSAISDIVFAFKVAEQTEHIAKYYELNISCPNIALKESLYQIEQLKRLLEQLKELKMTRPVYIKMPISQNDAEFTQLIKLIQQYNYIKGVIIGNLQTKRDVSLFNPAEIAAAGKGNFSGKPTFLRSNELIKLTRQLVGPTWTIIGCGGVFSPADALQKIEAGANLVQLITGLVFMGPQLPAQIVETLQDN